MPDALEDLEQEARRGEQAAPAGGAGPAPGAAPGAGPEPAAPAPRTESVDEWRDSIKFVAGIVREAYPQLAPVWNDERLDELGSRLHVVAAKHGWSIGGWFLKWKEEIALAMFAGPLLRDTARVFKAKEGAPARPAAPGGAAASPAPASSGDDAPAQVVPGVIQPNTGDDIT